MLSVLLLVLVINNVYGYGWQWASYPPKTPGQFYGTAPSCNGHCETPNIYLWFSGLTEGDGKLCTSGSKVYCNTAPDPWASTQWKGTAPSCGASCGDCSPGYCIATDQAGDGKACATGRKVLCGGTAPPVSGSPVSDIKLVNTTEIEMGLVFKVYNDDQLSLISNDNHSFLIDGIVQFLGKHEAPVSTDVSQAVVNGILINNWDDYLVNIKLKYDTVLNAQYVIEFLHNHDDISFLLKQQLSTMDAEFSNIDTQFVEANIATQYISTPHTTQLIN